MSINSKVVKIKSNVSIHTDTKSKIECYHFEGYKNFSSITYVDTEDRSTATLFFEEVEDVDELIGHLQEVRKNLTKD